MSNVPLKPRYEITYGGRGAGKTATIIRAQSQEIERLRSALGELYEMCLADAAKDVGNVVSFKGKVRRFIEKVKAIENSRAALNGETRTEEKVR